MVAHAKKQISLIFHRYLRGEQGLKKLRLTFNGDRLKPTDPFMRSHNATQREPMEPLTLDGQTVERVALKNGRELIADNVVSGTPVAIVSFIVVEANIRSA